MPAFKTTAIILRTYDFKDFDKIVVLYSKDFGLIRAIAKGAKRPKSNLRGRIEPTICAEFVLFEGKNLHTINQCDVVESFKNIRRDLKKITFACYFLELSAAFAVEKDPAALTFYNMIFDILERLEKSPEETLDICLNDFEFQLISYAGYEPVFELCTRCNSNLDSVSRLYFSPYMGSVVCSNCTSESSGLAELSPELYEYMKNLKVKPENANIPDKTTIIKAHNILFNYISQKTNYKLKTPKLIESLCLG